MKQLVAILMFVAFLSLGGPLSAQDQAAPDGQASPSDQSVQSAQPQTEPAPVAPQTPAEAAPPSQVPVSPPAKPPNRAAKSLKKRKPGTKTSAAGHKVVVRNGGARDESAQLAPGMSKEQERHNREATAKLLTATDTNVKGVAGRQLTPAQQSLLDQIHTYVRQSKDASDAGDLARAQTLASKAHLLSDELKK